MNHTYNIPFPSVMILITSSNITRFSGANGIYLTKLQSFEYTTSVPSLISFSDSFNGVTSNFTVNFNNFSTMTSLLRVFKGCTNFNGSITSLNTLNVDSMDEMFSGCTSFDQDLLSFNMGLVTSATDMLNNTGLSVTNYSNTLFGWSGQPLQQNVTFGALGLQYNSTDGLTGRNILTSDPNNWNIIGDSPACILSFCKILTKNGYKQAKDLKEGEYILSENNKEIQIKSIYNSKHKLTHETPLQYLPCIIPKGVMCAQDDIYLTSGHCMKFNEEWGGPHYFNMKKCTFEELSELGLEELDYYHI